MKGLFTCVSVYRTVALAALVFCCVFLLHPHLPRRYTPFQERSEPLPRTPSVSLSTAYQPAEAWKALHFCKAAYCPIENVSTWDCGNACANATPHFHVFNVYDNTSTGNVGFSGLDHYAGRIVAAFRGTSNTANWIEDLEFWSTPYPNPSCGEDCRVHRGFYKAYESVRGQLLLDIASMQERYPTYTLFITGHSLGGAMAVLTTVELTARSGSLDARVAGKLDRLPLVPVELYTFGEPRVGNARFTNWSTSLLATAKHFRVTHARDPVPHLPPRSWGYVHLPQELWYPTDNDTMVSCDDGSDFEDAKCSNSVYATNVADHLIYLGVCTRCECTTTDMEEIFSYELTPEL